MLEGYRSDDAEVVLITTGSITGTTRMIVDEMRGEGYLVGLIKLRYLRPFPTKQLTNLLKDIKVVGVVDKNISFGYEGTIFTNVNSAILQENLLPKVHNFICGLGGRDVTKDNIRDMFRAMLSSAKGEPVDKIQYMNVRCEL